MTDLSDQGGERGDGRTRRGRSAPAGIHRSPATEAAAAPALHEARRLYGLNRRRLEMLGAPLCVDAAWNMLLDLFISEGEGRRLSVSAAVIGSMFSYSTAMRYVNLLVDAGLVERTPDQRDRRRSFLSLSRTGRAALADLLAAGPARPRRRPPRP